MKTKKCFHCKLYLTLNNFYLDKSRKDGYSFQCTPCRKLYSQTEQHKNTRRNYRLKNIDKFKLKDKIHYEKYRDKKLKWQNEYVFTNKDAINARRKTHNLKSKHTLQNKLAFILRNRLNKIVKKENKKFSAVQELGCDLEYLIRHLEIQFQNGMTWENRGKNCWHIDHIKPLNTFDLTDEKQYKEANHYSNLRPLWAQQNLTRRKNGID